MKERVGWKRPNSIDPFGAQTFDGRPDNCSIFLTKCTIFAGMRVKSSDGETRAQNAETLGKIARGDAPGLDHQLEGQS
ncbi:hypothetical protein D3C83_100080 [compost metagenome]